MRICDKVNDLGQRLELKQRVTLFLFGNDNGKRNLCRADYHEGGCLDFWYRHREEVRILNMILSADLEPIGGLKDAVGALIAVIGVLGIALRIIKKAL